MRKVTAPEIRFWAKVDKSGGPDACWPWMAARLKTGYGVFQLRRGKSGYAHRFSYSLVHGRIPAGMDVCHHCDNPPRVNPKHLWLGTALENNRDSIAKGRYRYSFEDSTRVRGERHHLAKLNSEKVRVIRTLFSSGTSAPTLAARFGVCRGTIWQVILGETWGHVH